MIKEMDDLDIVINKCTIATVDIALDCLKSDVRGKAIVKLKELFLFTLNNKCLISSDIYICHYCGFKGGQVEAGGVLHCPNPLCYGPGNAYFRSELDSFIIDTDEWFEKGLAHLEKNDNLLFDVVRVLISWKHRLREAKKKEIYPEIPLSVKYVKEENVKINNKLLDVVQKAYQKHCLDDDSIGWDELDDMLHDTLCEVMGDKEYQKWLEVVIKKND